MATLIVSGMSLTGSQAKGNNVATSNNYDNLREDNIEEYKFVGLFKKVQVHLSLSMMGSN